MSFLSRLFADRKGELEEEIQAHLQMAIQDRRDRGEAPKQAQASAMREFGNVMLVKDVTREMWGWVWLERLLQDLRYALRQLRKSPGFTCAVIGTLALGLGATAAMFTVVDRVLLRPLPYENPRQLVVVQEAGKRGAIPYGAPFLDLQQWRERSHTLDKIAYYTASSDLGHRSFLEGNTGAAMQVNAPNISANLFSTLGVHPAMGRAFEARRDSGSAQPGEARSIILSDTVWRTVYGGNSKILGTIVKLDGESYTVVGVMPRGFTFPFDGAWVWRPIVLGNADAVRTKHVAPDYEVIARLKPGVRLQRAEAELKTIQADVAKAYTDPYERDQVTSIRLQRYGDSLVSGDMKKALLALFGASGVLWLIACVNVTSLLLARSMGRQREIAVRGALGASRWRIVQQLLIEGVVLSIAASLLGLGLAILTLRLFKHGLTEQFNIHARLMPNLSVICILLALTVVSALLASAWPAITAAKTSIDPVLRQGSPQAGIGGTRHRSRALLVVAQIAMSLTLLVGCGLLLRTIYALRHVPLGFRTDHVIVANMAIPSYKFVGRDMTTELYQPLVERVQHLPGVQSASLMTEVPLGKTFQMMFSFGEGGPGNSAAQARRRELRSQFRAVGPEMQKVFGFRMLRGRFFNEGDTPTSQPVVVVNRAFVKAYTGEDRDPGRILGETLLNYSKDRRAIVVGVLNDERQVSIAEQSQPEIEVCLPQITPDSGFYNFAEGMAMDLAVRTDRSPSSIIPQLRQLLRKASPELAASNFTTMDQVVEDSYGSQRLAARLLEIFGGAALLLCVSGIYGLLAYLVTQRTRELGLRIALGAQRGDVMWLVLRQAGWMLLAGSGIGLILAYLSSLLLRTFLYGVKPHDPWTMAAVTLLLLGGGLASAYFPARRAAAVDPMQALRAE